MMTSWKRRRTISVFRMVRELFLLKNCSQARRVTSLAFVLCCFAYVYTCSQFFSGALIVWVSTITCLFGFRPSIKRLCA